MYNKNQFQNKFTNTVQELNFLIDMLYITPCILTRNIILNQVRYKISDIEMLADIVANNNQIQPVSTLPQVQPIQQSEGNFTIEDLSKYNGKNGNPAYIAVSGIVYEVTNNAAWAAATHFGLTAGKDLTEQFNSCHAGQQILNKLKVVGRLV